MKLLTNRHRPASVLILAAALSAFTALALSGCDPSTSPAATIRKSSLPAAAKSATPAPTGLEFPSNGDTWSDIRLHWTGSALLPMYPATYVWTVNVRKQDGYYSILNWGPDKDFVSGSYYGAQPFPQGKGDKSQSKLQRWSISASSRDYSTDVNGHSTDLGHGEWKTQALRVYDDGANKVHEYFWDLPDTSKVVRTLLDRTYGAVKPPSPAVNIGSAPWDPRSTRLSGIVRGLQFYDAKLATSDLVAEADAPMATGAGQASIWYLNTNPTPDDISDKSGQGHHPTWVSSAKAALWTGTAAPAPPEVTISLTPSEVAFGESATLLWTSTEADDCTAGGSWKGKREPSGSETVSAPTGVSAFTLTCTGPGGSATASTSLIVAPMPEPLPDPLPIPAPTPSDPVPQVPPIDTGSLGLPVPPMEPPASVPSPQPVPIPLPLPVPDSALPPVSVPDSSPDQVPVPAPDTTVPPIILPDPIPTPVPAPIPLPVPASPMGLEFNGNENPYYDARIRFTGPNLQPMYPTTIVFRVRPRAQQGYFTTFFWGPEGDYTGNGFYGAHPYPSEEPRDSSKTHQWEISVSGHDHLNDANGHDTRVVYGEWKTQAFRAWDTGSKKIHEFFWDLPDTTKVIRVVLDIPYGPLPDRTNSLTFGNAQFSPVSEHCNCTLRGLQTYSSNLPIDDLLKEISAPLSTGTGAENIWYLNINPTPDDIADKSGKGHDPTWFGPYHAGPWSGQ